MKLIGTLALLTAMLLGVIIAAGRAQTWFWEIILWSLAAVLAGGLFWGIARAARQ